MATSLVISGSISMISSGVKTTLDGQATIELPSGSDGGMVNLELNDSDYELIGPPVANYTIIWLMIKHIAGEGVVVVWKGFPGDLSEVATLRPGEFYLTRTEVGITTAKTVSGTAQIAYFAARGN